MSNDDREKEVRKDIEDCRETGLDRARSFYEGELKGIQEERERILNIIKLRNGQLILESDEWSGSEKCQFYARINELKELKQKIKERKQKYYQKNKEEIKTKRLKYCKKRKRRCIDCGKLVWMTSKRCIDCQNKSRSGKLHHLWKGDKASYTAIHIWIRRHKPKPNVCEICKIKKPREVANISGEYKRDVNDFKWLCNSCHKKFDKKKL